MATKKTTAPTATFAVIELSGKQYLVKAGDKITAEKLTTKDGEKLNLDSVLLVTAGEIVKVGTPFVAGASVELVLEKTDKGEKIEIRKFKAKSRYRRTTGHRQTVSHLTVTNINFK